MKQFEYEQRAYLAISARLLASSANVFISLKVCFSANVFDSTGWRPCKVLCSAAHAASRASLPNLFLFVNAVWKFAPAISHISTLTILTRLIDYNKPFGIPFLFYFPPPFEPVLVRHKFVLFFFILYTNFCWIAPASTVIVLTRWSTTRFHALPLNA